MSKDEQAKILTASIEKYVDMLIGMGKLDKANRDSAILEYKKMANIV